MKTHVFLVGVLAGATLMLCVAWDKPDRRPDNESRNKAAIEEIAALDVLEADLSAAGNNGAAIRSAWGKWIGAQRKVVRKKAQGGR